MGVAVGVRVGVLEGAPVGVMVGVRVGVAVGVLVGPPVGVIVGVLVGVAVGVFVTAGVEVVVPPPGYGQSIDALPEHGGLPPKVQPGGSSSKEQILSSGSQPIRHGMANALDGKTTEATTTKTAISGRRAKPLRDEF